MKNVSFVLNQGEFYLRGGFEIEGSNEEICQAISAQVLKFVARVKKYRMKTNFKAGKKFTITIAIDGKKYESTDAFFEMVDSGKLVLGEVSIASNRTANFVELVNDTVLG